jgi:glucan biosynthesis protein C
MMMPYIASSTFIAIYWSVGFESQQVLLEGVFLDLLYSSATWFWLLALVGLGRKYLRFENRFLNYANEGSYPFYILHQTVIVLFAYLIFRWSWGIAPKYILLTTISLVTTVLVYELVRSNRPTRFLFGMKGAKRAAR